jgi:hypothetical protein
MVCTIKYRVFLQIFHQAQGKPSEASKAWSPRENRPVVSGNWDPMGGPGLHRHSKIWTKAWKILDMSLKSLKSFESWTCWTLKIIELHVRPFEFLKHAYRFWKLLYLKLISSYPHQTLISNSFCSNSFRFWSAKTDVLSYWSRSGDAAWLWVVPKGLIRKDFIRTAPHAGVICPLKIIQNAGFLESFRRGLFWWYFASYNIFAPANTNMCHRIYTAQSQHAWIFCNYMYRLIDE